MEPTSEELHEVRAAVDAYWRDKPGLSTTPALLSLLYDIDLLPEQIRLMVNVNRMIAVCELFRRVPPEALKK